MIHRIVFSKISSMMIYFTIILITILIGEVYPFSFYPMYNSFPIWSYVFYFKDEKGATIKLPKSTHADLSHKFYSECQKQGIAYGNGIESIEDMERVGLSITNTFFNANKINNKSVSEIKFFRIHNRFNNNIIISDTMLISTLHVN